MSNSRKKRAVVLLSGGLDSSVSLYLAKSRRFECYPLIFDYRQRHLRELSSARKISRIAGFRPQVIKISLPWKGSSLLDKKIKIEAAAKKKTAIPCTYVPARNIIFLSFAISYAESIGAESVFIGANAVDYSGYPDCRPEFYRAFRKVVSCGTKTGAYGRGIRIEAPLINKTKKDIVKLGFRLGVPLELTWSCYRGGARPCGKCESCYFRARGFKQAGINDASLRKG